MIWRTMSEFGPSRQFAAMQKFSRFRGEADMDGRETLMDSDANDRAPRGRELSVREDLTRIIVDWSGSWQAARPGNWLGRSPATKAALGR